MSAYLLQNEKFQIISDWLYTQSINQNSEHFFDTICFTGFNEKRKEFNGTIEEWAKSTTSSVVRDLYNLNRLSLTTRYGESYDKNDNTQFSPVFNNSIHENTLIETLKCLKYQCSEYLTCETKLFEKLCIFIGKLCENIFDRDE